MPTARGPHRCSSARMPGGGALAGVLLIAGLLFAVLRDVQRNSAAALHAPCKGVSIRCRAKRTAEPSRWSQTSLRMTRARFYSLSCETYSGTSGRRGGKAGCAEFLFAVVRDVQRNGRLGGGQHAQLVVSIRCRARRTAEPGHVPAEARCTNRFYSLSCETYSGTTSTTRRTVIWRFLFAGVRDVQRNELYDQGITTAPAKFLFAGVRDVQRNMTNQVNTLRIFAGFYSLACETYSGTHREQGARRPARRVSIRCRARRTAEPCPLRRRR